jgi:uncharacterized protein YdeI (YjbR/CyaY-like superfamily)
MAKMDKEALPKVWATDREEWRAWLLENHQTERAVWLYMYNKSAGKPSIDWDAAVDEALCFGWIDSVVNRVDEYTRRQYFSPRKPQGNWSRINKEKVEKLTAEGRMMPAGQAAIDRARENGSWENIDSVEAMIIPEVFQTWLDSDSEGSAYFDSLSKTKRWSMLYWLNSAKRPETKAKRLAEITDALSQSTIPDRFRT